MTTVAGLAGALAGVVPAGEPANGVEWKSEKFSGYAEFKRADTLVVGWRRR